MAFRPKGSANAAPARSGGLGSRPGSTCPLPLLAGLMMAVARYL